MNTNKEVNKQEERECEACIGTGEDQCFGMKCLACDGTGIEQPARQSSIDTGDRFKNWLEERIESYEQEKVIHGDKERIKARLSMLNETLENYNRWTANPPIDTGVEAEESGDLFIHIASGQVHECIGTDEKKIWYVPDGEMESKSFLPEECRLLTPAEKYVLTVYDTKYPQMADKEIKAFIAGAKWASSGEAVDWIPVSKINTLSKGDKVKIVVKVTGLESDCVHTDIGLVPKKDITDVLPKTKKP